MCSINIIKILTKHIQLQGIELIHLYTLILQENSKDK
jgi:hypothetical protein